MSIKHFLNLFFCQDYHKKWQVVFWLNTVLLLYLTFSTPSNLGLDLEHLDKLFHFIGFGAFTFFLYLGYPNLKNLKIILISLALGIFVEIVQSILPYRGFDLLDLVADCIGTLVAVFVLKSAQAHFGKL